jgi:hypothetical protein
MIRRSEGNYEIPDYIYSLLYFRRQKIMDIQYAPKDYAKMFALVAEIEVEKAYIEGMKSENTKRAIYGESPAYTEDDFGNAAHRLEEIAEKLREEI